MNTEGKCKRRKSYVFTVEEQIKLLELIEKEKAIIENKTTNKVTNEEKDLVWERIATRYNATALQHRSIDQLKSKFDNLKTKARKVVAEQKTYIRGTGGGSPPSQTFGVVIEMVLRIINYKTVVGLKNVFDCDNENHGTSNIEREEIVADRVPINNDYAVTDVDVFVGTDDPIIINVPPESTLNLAAKETPNRKDQQLVSDTPEIEKNNVTEPSGSTFVQAEIPWSSYTPRKLKEPVSKKLRPAIRNPVIEAKEKYYRTRTLDLEDQIRIRKEQDRRQEEKHQKEMRLLDLEIKLKEKQLSLDRHQ